MNKILFQISFRIAQLAPDPVFTIYLGLAAVHLVAMLCYLAHDELLLAFCAAAASLSYLFLAAAHRLGY